tara:strand:- start:2172 stop:2807 length:636 start_codon:yes stop_codon:yes gene_type:complete
MNYAALVTAIQDYTQNAETSFVANIPNFVQQAEERINRSIMLPELRKNATTTLTAGSKYLARPSDFISVFSFAVINAAGAYTYLIDKDVNFVREAYPDPATTGTPEYYAQFDGDRAGDDGNFILGPSTDAIYTAELHYYYDPASIVTAGTSWYGDNAEAALLYGSLIEAYTYMKGEQDLIALYSTRYSEALGQLTGVQLRSAQDEYRDGKL